MRDVKYAARAVRRSKASSAAAILILAIGIGANTAVFTFLDRLLFRPLPVPKPSQLVLISTSTVDKNDKSGKRMSNSYITYESYVHMRDHNQVFSGLAAESYLGPRERRLRQKIERPAEPIAVSGNYFDVLGRPPLLGRALAPSDDARSGASHVAVASYRFWTRRYNRAPDVLGQTIYFSDVPFTIVGVMPAGFFGTHQGYDPDIYLPLGSLPELFDFDPLARGASMGPIGRLRPGLALQAAQSNLQALWDQVPSAQKDSFAQIECRDGSVGHAGTEGEKQRSLVLLAVIAALLLLMGCTNVACLLIARGAARHHEIAHSYFAGRRQGVRATANINGERSIGARRRRRRIAGGILGGPSAAGCVQLEKPADRSYAGLARPGIRSRCITGHWNSLRHCAGVASPARRPRGPHARSDGRAAVCVRTSIGGDRSGALAHHGRGRGGVYPQFSESAGGSYRLRGKPCFRH